MDYNNVMKAGDPSPKQLLYTTYPVYIATLRIPFTTFPNRVLLSRYSLIFIFFRSEWTPSH